MDPPTEGLDPVPPPPPIYPPIYMDCHATTPVDDRVLAAMLPYWSQHFGNPASAGHAYGWAAEAAVERSRARLAEIIGATPEEIIFTSGATEANNLAIQGVAEAQMHRGRHLVTVATEHRAVLDPYHYLAQLGFETTVLPVRGDGLLDLAQLEAALRPETILVSVMAANNEIGVLQPIAQIGAICRDRQILFHSDAAQAIGKIPVNVDDWAVDLLSLTAHKAYGPKGIGALYVRRSGWRRGRALSLAPQLHGGGQQGGLRSGTLPVPLIVGLAEAIALAVCLLPEESQRLTALRDRLWQQLAAAFPAISGDGIALPRPIPLQPSVPGHPRAIQLLQNGHPVARLPGNLNFSVAGIEGSGLLAPLRSTVALSSGSACSSALTEGSPAPSHVLLALGRSPRLALASLRVGLGRFSNQSEVDLVSTATIRAIKLLHDATLQGPGVD